MKIFAQHGYGPGDKINQAASEGIIQGAVFGAKDISPEKLEKFTNDLRSSQDEFDVLFDPQFYVSLSVNNPNTRLGKLDDFPYFKGYRRSALEPSDNIKIIVDEVCSFQANLNLSGIIGPNILISRSFDTIEAAIAKNFIRETGKWSKKNNPKVPVYATICISSKALLDKNELKIFLSDITLLEEPVDGFYLLIASDSGDSRFEIMQADVLAAWFLITYSLKVNGFKVINGYSNILAPFLASIGADAACTGWFNTLRVFSMERFTPTKSGGRLPIQRYLSNKLLKRITFHELNALSKIHPEVRNFLPHDQNYLSGEPQRNLEVLQTWEALEKLCKTMVTGDIEENLNNCNDAILNAIESYAQISVQGYSLDYKSRDEHLEQLSTGIRIFKEAAEL